MSMIHSLHRSFLYLLAGCTILAPIFAKSPANASEFAMSIPAGTERVWIGPSCWANRLQDWRVSHGRIACIAEQARLKMRTLYCLTHPLDSAPLSFTVSVRCGLMGDSNATRPDASCGILIGVGGEGMDHRSAALIHGARGKGMGVYVGVTASGQIVIESDSGRTSQPLAGFGDRWPKEGLALEVRGAPGGQTGYRCIVTITRPDDTVLSRIEHPIHSQTLAGGLALVAHPGSQAKGRAGGRWWFEDWRAKGKRLTSHPSRALGPILSTQYTLSRGVLKMTAQFMPLDERRTHRTELWAIHDDGPIKLAETDLAIPSYTATFRVADWDATRDRPYRIVYRSRPVSEGGQETEEFAYQGTVRRDPVEKEMIVVAGFTGNHNVLHGFARAGFDYTRHIWFPHHDVVSNVANHEPDLLFFSGDQIYEGASPTFPDTDPEWIKLDYLYKWYLWCWAYRDLTRDRPSICIPDDHDVYQGNLWGQNARRSPGRDHDGGYVHPADFVKMVERTQTSHLPDPHQPEPLEQGIGAYYTDLVWGRIGIAILEDRKFKSGCKRGDMPPSGTGRPDHFNDPAFDVSQLDVAGATLLGSKQLEFLQEFSEDWYRQDMKMAVSQTIFANMATHHGSNLMRLIADLDSNGWPQSGRNRAVRALRRGFIFHLGGDQHLATIVHHGVETHGDAMWSFCVPSVANFYPRAWAPHLDGEYSYPAPADYTGPHRDGFNHPVTVWAATNPGRDMGQDPPELHDRMPGYGIVRLNKKARTITMECWPRSADTNDPQARQYLGWPKTISMFDNYDRQPVAWLPTIEVDGMDSPVVQVIHELTQDVVYTVRILGQRFKPRVFQSGVYTVIVSDLETSKRLERHGIRAVDIDEGDAGKLRWEL